jgi:hypothetical protein
LGPATQVQPVQSLFLSLEYAKSIPPLIFRHAATLAVANQLVEQGVFGALEIRPDSGVWIYFPQLSPVESAQVKTFLPQNEEIDLEG